MKNLMFGFLVLMAFATFGVEAMAQRGDRVCFFENDNYQGASFCLRAGEVRDNLENYGFNDKISSILIEGRLSVQVYENAYYQGQTLRISQSTNSMRVFGAQWNDRISSIRVDGGNHPGPGPGPGPIPGPGGGDLRASRLDCRQQQNARICNANISWNLRGGNQQEAGMVTVIVPTSPNANERRDRLFACGRSGNQAAPWIYAGHTYIFKLWATRECREGANFGRPVEEITVRAQ